MPFGYRAPFWSRRRSENDDDEDIEYSLLGGGQPDTVIDLTQEEYRNHTIGENNSDDDNNSDNNGVDVDLNDDDIGRFDIANIDPLERREVQLRFQREFIRSFRYHAQRVRHRSRNQGATEAGRGGLDEHTSSVLENTGLEGGARNGDGGNNGENDGSIGNDPANTNVENAAAGANNQAGGFLSEVVDMVGAVIIPMIILRMMRSVINFVTCSNDYLLDISNYISIPYEILLSNNVSFGNVQIRSPRIEMQVPLLSSSSSSSSSFPTSSSSKRSSSVSVKGAFATAALSMTKSVLRSAGRLVGYSATSPHQVSDHDLSYLAMATAIQVFVPNNHQACPVPGASDAQGKTRKFQSSVTRFLRNNRPNERLNPDAIFQDYKNHRFIVIDSLLLKFSNAVLASYPNFFVQYPLLLRVVTVLIYGTYSLVFSGYLSTTFFFYAVCLAMTCTRKWYEFDKFFLKVLEESNGVF